MSNIAPPRVRLIPEGAPFTPEQRDWLDGFFAGLLSLDDAPSRSRPDEVGALGSEIAGEASGAKNPLDDGDDGTAAWHDQCLPLPERMSLAEGRPLRRRMMAAMAQQDCGQCGYNCENYANAIFLGGESRTNLCVPGGKSTARMLKKLLEDAGVDAASAQAEVPGQEASSHPPKPGTTRDSPAEAVFLSRTRLNKAASEKETWHIEFDLGESGLDYAVGDAFGVFPSNDPALVHSVISAIGAKPDHAIGARSLWERLHDETSLAPAPDGLFQLISCLVGGERRKKARALAAGEDPDGDAATLDVLTALQKFPGVAPDPEAFVESLDPLQPRLYSIASSPKVHPKRLALAIDTLRYSIGGRRRLGVASTFLGERASPGEKLRVYVQKASHFGLPADHVTPIIMIGPGTGIAPFRAFLQERVAIRTAGGAPGPNWLFFGHQHSDCDFFYEEELTALQTAGVLTRLTLAWSRDGSEKIYVQHRMREFGGDIWSWLNDGACLYVCGDAKRMAKDVEQALIDVVGTFGNRSPDEAKAYIADLKKSSRYQADVY
jgi:sulfite reductase (NADPH) flavoprotein alpha-component